MRRILLAFVAAAALAGPAAAPATTPSWAQDRSDIAPDPSVCFGVLPNGMRYAIMRNTTPTGQTAIRLRIGSGSLEESDNQQGLAHVLEHMAFEGSTHVPRGEMIKILQREGLAFGPDTNAQTGWTQTVYMLDLPGASPSLIDTGLMLMRETASELLIDPAALETERGVVLSEERLRDTPLYRANKAQIDLFAQNQRVTERFPIGKVDTVKTAPVSLIRDFYRANYRPDRATLIVVGSFDPAVVETQIKARFADWKPAGTPAAEPDLGQVEKRGLTVSVVDLPGAQTLVDVGWARPYDDAPDTRAKRRREIVDDLAIAVLNRRLNRLATAPNPPFLLAHAEFDNLIRSTKIALIRGATAPGAWRPGLGAIDQETRRLTRYGVSQAEIDREIEEIRARLVARANAASTRTTTSLAQGLVASVDNDSVFTAPSDSLAIFDASAKNVTPEEISAAARQIFTGAGPLVEIESPTPIEGGAAAVSSAYAEATAAPVSAPATETQVAWPYTSFGPTGTVVERKDIVDLGVTQVRFANGDTLTVKPTQFSSDQVLVSVRFGRGRLGLPRDPMVADWASPAIVLDGVGTLTLEDMQRALAGKVYNATITEQDDAFELRGATRPADLATQLQVLAAHMAHPAFRPETFERVRQLTLAGLQQQAATPAGVLSRDLEGLLHDNDPRWQSVTAQEATAEKPADLVAVLAGPLAKDPIEVTIVGDVSAQEAIERVAATFGALPARGAGGPIPPGSEQTRFPSAAAKPVVETDTGRADQAIGLAAWPLTDIYQDLRQSRADELAGDILSNRLIDKVRNSEGATYSPQVAVSLSPVFRGYGFAAAMVEMPPEKLSGFYADLDALTADMRDHGVTADELVRARNPRLSRAARALQMNEFWLRSLAGSIADPRRLDLIRTSEEGYRQVTQSDIQAAARRMFESSRTWRLEIKASGAP